MFVLAVCGAAVRVDVLKDEVNTDCNSRLSELERDERVCNEVPVPSTRHFLFGATPIVFMLSWWQ